MSYVRNANITAATQVCHRDTSFANADITAATQICRRDTSFANANITAATKICHRDTSSANTNITAERHICHADSSSANTNITATTSQPRPRRRLSAPQLLQKLCVLHLPTKSEPRPQRRLSAPQLLQEALRTAPATRKRAAATAATIRATAPSGSSAYCACHAKASRGHGGDYPRRSSFRKLCVLRLPRKSEPRPRRRLSAPQLLQEALRTAPATQKRVAATAATIRAAAPSGSSAYCACHAKASRGHGGDYPRHTFFRQLCVLRLPRKSEPRPRRRLSAPQLLQEALRTAPATQKRAAATAATIRATPSSGSSANCACHAKASRGHGGDYPRHTFFRQLCVLRLRSSFRKLCVLRLPRKSPPRPRRRLSAPQLLQAALPTAPATQKRAAATAATIRATPPPEAMCTAPANQKRTAATAATIRAAAPSGSSAYCACHAKARRGHGGDYPRHTFFRQLCVLRLPRKSEPRPRRRLSAPQLLQEALRTAPATQKRVAATAATIRATPSSGSSAYCACHAKASRGHGGDYPRRSSFRKLCVLHLPRKSESRPRRRLSAPHLLQAALRTAPATQKRAAATAATVRAAAPSGGSVYCACQSAPQLLQEAACTAPVCEMSCV